jgi:hypothetical protein
MTWREYADGKAKSFDHHVRDFYYLMEGGGCFEYMYCESCGYDIGDHTLIEGYPFANTFFVYCKKEVK